jgi:hypothetical protein
LQRKDLYYSGATFWLPRKIRQAQACEAEKQQRKLKLLQKKERRVKQERLKEERNCKRAGKSAAHAA